MIIQKSRRKYIIGYKHHTNVCHMTNAKKKPVKKKTAKKAPAKKAVAKKSESKEPAKKSAPAKKKAPAKKASQVSVTARPITTSTTATDIKVDFTISGAPETFSSALSEVIRVNDVVDRSLRKRMLKWFTRK